MSGDPFAFDYRTANDLVKLLKRTRNGEFAAELDSSVPVDTAPKFVWAYVPTSVTATYDSTVKAWKIGSNQVYLPINISKDGTGQVQWGMINDDGTYAGGITCTIYTPKLSSNQAAPKVGVGFYLGMVFGTDASNNPTVLIGLPPVSGSGASGGNAVIEVVTDVTCTPSGLEVSTVTLSGADYDNAVIRQFLALSDVTPKSFLGNQGRAVVVNENATALEFGPIVSNIATTFISLSDTPNTYGSTNTYKVLTVSSNNASISFSANNVTTGYSVKGGGNPNDPAYTAITLVNDEASPDANKFYGTNSSKVKGWHEITLKNLADFPDMSGASEKVLAVNYMENALEWKELSFTSLTDCPSEFTGAAGKLLKVDLQETAIEFVDFKFIDLPDVPSSYAGQGGKFVSVTVQEDGLEFSAIDIATIQDDLQALSLTVDDHETRITTLENSMSTVQSDLASLQSTSTTNTSDIQSIQSQITVIEGDITTIQSSLSSLESTVNSLDSTVSGHTTSISTLQTDLSNLNTTVGQLTTQVTTLESTVSGLESTVNSLDSTVSSHTSQISNLESSVTTLQGQVSTLEGTTSTHTGQISTLESGLAAAESNITQIQSDISSIQTDLQTVTTGLTQAQSDIGQLQSDSTQHGSDIADILSRLSTAEANIQSLQTDLATAQGNISTLQSDYSSLDARITALGG